MPVNGTVEMKERWTAKLISSVMVWSEQKHEAGKLLFHQFHIEHDSLNSYVHKLDKTESSAYQFGRSQRTTSNIRSLGIEYGWGTGKD